MDDLGRIMADDQANTQRREARKFVTAIAGDVTAYYAALHDAGIGGELRERLTQDFGCKWHTYQLEDAEIDLSVLYAGEDGE